MFFGKIHILFINKEDWNDVCVEVVSLSLGLYRLGNVCGISFLSENVGAVHNSKSVCTVHVGKVFCCCCLDGIMFFIRMDL